MNKDHHVKLNKPDPEKSPVSLFLSYVQNLGDTDMGMEKELLLKRKWKGKETGEGNGVNMIKVQDILEQKCSPYTT